MEPHWLARDYSPPTWRSQTTKEQKREVTVLREAHQRQVEETIKTLPERPKGLYKNSLN